MRDQILKLSFIKELTYQERLEAERIIDKGADVALFYFWYNLIRAHYHPVFTDEMVEKQARYFADRNPDFEHEIIDWFNRYNDKVKTYATSSSINSPTRPSMRGFIKAVSGWKANQL